MKNKSLLYWSLLRQIVYNFIKLKNIPNFYKLCPDTIFNNYDNTKYIRKILRGKYIYLIQFYFIFFIQVFKN